MMGLPEAARLGIDRRAGVHRYDEGERAAQAGAGAVDPDAAAVQLDEAARQRQDEAAALLLAPVAVVELLESREHAVLVAGCDADAGVEDRHADRGPCRQGQPVADT